METLEYLLANISGRVRRETWQGRQWLVAPVRLLPREGVLEGSDGPIFYPADQVATNPDGWNGMPIVLGHPVENGRHVSGRHPKVLEKQFLGWLFESRIANGLEAEAWFDEEVSRKRDSRITEALNATRPLEVSTGLFLEKLPVPIGKVSVYNGIPYSYSSRNYRPDHLAVLLDQRGACSVDQGCGVLVNEDQKGAFNAWLESVWRFLTLQGLPATPLPTDNLHPGQPQSKNTGKFKPVGAGSGKDPVHSAVQDGFHELPTNIVLTDYHRERGADAAAQAAQGENPPSWARDKAKWEKAKQIVQDKMPDCDDTYACVTYIYEHIGGVIGNSAPTEIPDGDPAMSYNRKADEQFVTANCDCYKGKDKLLANTELFPDEDLKKLKAHVEAELANRQVVNAVRQQFPAAKELTVNAMPAFIKEKVEAKEEECPEDMTEEECEEHKKGKKKPTGNGGSTGRDNNVYAGNQGKGTTVNQKEVEEGLAKSLGFQSVSHMKATLNAAKKVEQDAKKDLVIRLVGNIKDDDTRRAKGKKLMGKSVEELEEMVELIPVGNASDDTDDDSDEDDFLSTYNRGRQQLDYSGAAGGIHNRKGKADDVSKEVLPLPYTDYTEMAVYNGTAKR